MTSLYVICPPPIKNLGYAYGLEDFEHKMEMEWKKIAGMKYGKIIFRSIPPCHTSAQTPFQLLRFFAFSACRIFIIRSISECKKLNYVRFVVIIKKELKEKSTAK